MVQCADCGAQFHPLNNRGRKRTRCDHCRSLTTGAKAGDYTCAECGKSFWSPRKVKYCGAECRTKHGRLSNRKQVACCICGQEFVSATGKAKTCSTQCANKSRAVTNRLDDRRRTCVGCGKAFKMTKGSRRKGLYCSRNCAFQHKRDWGVCGTHGKTLIQLDKDRREMTTVSLFRSISEGAARWMNGWKCCAWCGVFFWKISNSGTCSRNCKFMHTGGDYRKCETCGENIHRKQSGKARNCKSCQYTKRRKQNDSSKAKRRIRIDAHFLETVDRASVFQRDRYQCWICLGLCRREYIAGDMSSPTIDHVVPLAKGGDHSYANCRTAHFICNSLKSDG